MNTGSMAKPDGVTRNDGGAAGAVAARLLIVEDEPKLAALMARYLEAGGYRTTTVADGRLVVPQVRETGPDLILLDLMLPGRDGIEICRELRTFSDVPIIIVTARVEEIDRLLGLELGADDYVCKPFSPRELVARVRAILRRTRGGSRGPQSPPGRAATAPGSTAAATTPGSAASADRPGEGLGVDWTDADSRPVRLLIDEDRHEVRLEDQVLELTPVEFRLLAILAAVPGRVLRRDGLLDRLYEDHRVVNDRTVDTHVKNLRRKLMQVVKDRDLIHSVYGIGYKFEP
jgi:two-component system, OmpR family, response regulator BaeR